MYSESILKIIWDFDNIFIYLKAVAAQYHEIEKSWVMLDYIIFIITYSYFFNLFHSQSLL